MSTWYTESFRGQALWDVTKSVDLSAANWETFARKCILKFDGGKLEATGKFDEVIYPTGYVSDILDSNQRKKFLEIFCHSGNHGKGGAVSRALINSAKTFHVGLNSVYKLFAEMYQYRMKDNSGLLTTSIRWVREFISHALITTAYSSRTLPKTMITAIDRIDWVHMARAEEWIQKGRQIRNLITLRWSAEAIKMSHGRRAIKDLTAIHDLNLPLNWKVYADGWITYVNVGDKDIYHALTTVDLDRLQQMCYSMGMIEAYCGVYKLTKSNDLAADIFIQTRKIVETIMVDAFQKVDHITAQGLCRDMKKAFGLYLSIAAGRLSDIGTQELESEIRTNGWDKSYNYKKYLSTLTTAPFDIAQDVGRLFKILPAPDYDIGASFVERQKEHLNMHPLDEISGENPCTVEEYRKYLRKFMIQTLIRANKGKGVGKPRQEEPWMKAYFDNGDIPYGLDWVDKIDLRGVYRYVERNADSAVAYKDTAACEEDLDEASSDQPFNHVKRNMLLRYLFDDSCPDTEKGRNGLFRQEHVHRVGFKMESHKTAARIFYIGNMQDRLLQSELEENTHRLATYASGYLIGQTEEFKVKKIMGMVAPQIAPDQRVYFLNFDIKRWSPGMNMAPQRAIHDIFGEIFDRVEYTESYRINEGATVLLNKRGYRGVYINPHADFEGYRGKQLTVMHCALMGYAVYRYRRATKHMITVDLCAFIDDGLATFIDDLKQGPGRFLQFVEIVRDTYRRLGFILELSKCYLSDRFAIFLNEIYLGGRHITYGLRAAMRIGTSAFEPHETIFDRLGAFAAGCQGAMKAGMDWITSYALFLWASTQVLRQYEVTRHMNAYAAVLWFYSPKFANGLQQPNMMQLGSNMASDGLNESIATIQLMAKVYTEYKKPYIAIIKSEVAPKTDTGILTAPRSIRPIKGAIQENRLSQAVLLRLKKMKLSRKANYLISLGKGFDMEEYAHALVANTPIIVETVMTDIIDSLPISIITALVKKFESSTTITQLVGIRRMKHIARLNRRDVGEAIRQFKLLVA